MTTSNVTYAGISCAGTEFFIYQDGLKIIQKGKVLPFCEISLDTLALIDQEIKNDPAAYLELIDMYADSKIKRTEQFIKCRFGGLDFTADIKDGKLQDGEYWDCPMHGNCKSEGILCKLPTHNGKRLDKVEIKLLQQMATNKTNDVIAEDLGVALGTFHKIKKNLYEKIGIQTKQEGVIISFMLNLIRF